MEPVGGAVVAQIAANQYLLAGDHFRIQYKPCTAAAPGAMVLRLEEGRLAGRFAVERVWNGDQPDYGLNFLDLPVLLRVTTGRAN